ncbi:hypothetical protein RJ639_032777 [Escallonia herrerae]|uniref:Endonuclease/exonuclease/phosphatase domain-containing protein n=1 Tax=Escallonia herrerae TaxID=1293975 RepID=A0AA89BEP9_9ASTE|nr:hypothetical protein RJ639_032777 [Escallonia herrerae]
MKPGDVQKREVDRFQDLKEELKIRGYTGIWKLIEEEGPILLPWRSIYEWWASPKSENHNSSTSALPGRLEVQLGLVGLEPSLTHSVPSVMEYQPNSTQVRVLLQRAYLVSKLWDDAPVILCGDFNCTPKSPLYNFIAEQKLNLSELPRDKLSGQAAAEIRPPKSHSPNIRAPSADNSAPSAIGVPESNAENVSSMRSLSQPQKKHVMKKNLVKEKTELTIGAPVSSLHDESGFSADQMDTNNEFSSANSCHEDILPCVIETGHREDDCAPSSSEHFQSNLNAGNKSFICDKGVNDNYSTDGDLEPASSSNSGLPLCENLQGTSFSNVVEASYSDVAFMEEEKMENLPLSKPTEATEEGTVGEEYTTFLSELHNTDFFTSDRKFLELNGFPGYPEPVHVEKIAYDPSSWTPAEIETATGSSDSTVVEHPLRLRSTYLEVEDFSGTRDSAGEPLVTSYNKRFLGTVDYIWRSEGLQTVSVLAPIPKNVMQRTPGYPTKKWGSDHIALVSELAFTKDSIVQDAIVLKAILGENGQHDFSDLIELKGGNLLFQASTEFPDLNVESDKRKAGKWIELSLWKDTGSWDSEGGKKLRVNYEINGTRGFHVLESGLKEKAGQRHSHLRL